MLAGLLFAVQDAEDRSGKIAATLPFAGLTLIEYQARLLANLGASQIVVIAARLTPELHGAIARIGRRGVAVDAVLTAAEAAKKVHPLAGLVMLADGLVSTEAVIAPLAEQGGDALLVFDASKPPAGLERISGRTIWAGAARLAPARLNEVAMLPQDYDVQSSLVRAAAQAGAAHVLVNVDDVRCSHGVELRSDGLENRANPVISSMLSVRRDWFDRWVVAPVARRLLAFLVRNQVTTMVAAGAAFTLTLIGLSALYMGYQLSGSAAVLAGVVIASAGAALASLRDEARLRTGFSEGVFAFLSLALLLLGRSIDQTTGQVSGRILAIVLVTAAALGNRAAMESTRRAWWGSPPVYLTLSAIAIIAGWPQVGLAMAAGYAAITLASAIEALRHDAQRTGSTRTIMLANSATDKDQ